VPQARQVADGVWRTINGRNLRENILPTRTRANLILVKGPVHRVQRVLLRRL
jgi:type I pantothenate kinase